MTEPAHAALLHRSLGALRALGASGDAARGYYVPGRLEFLGKHTDYAGGRSLVCAVERGISLAAVPRRDTRIRITDANGGNTATFDIAAALPTAAGDWSTYPRTVARRLAHNFAGGLCGADIAFASDLPRAAGLASSSALIVACFAALADVNALQNRPEYTALARRAEDLAGYLACIENGRAFGTLAGDVGVGTSGGSEDHVAIVCSKPGALGQYAFTPIRFERSVPLPDDVAFVIAVSGIVADKTGGARDRYNRAARAAETILELWRTATGRHDASLAAAAASGPHAPQRLRDIVRAGCAGFAVQELVGRLEQFLAETNDIVPRAGDALLRRDVAALGPLVDHSQDLAERLLGNQVPETVALARRARELGALAASSFGAGFGGSVWAMVPTDAAADFRGLWEATYRREFPGAAALSEFFVTRAGPPLVRL